MKLHRSSHPSSILTIAGVNVKGTDKPILTAKTTRRITRMGIQQLMHGY